MGQALTNKGDRKGISRQAIARWIQINCNKEGGAQFNTCLRKAIEKGMKEGLLKAGSTDARYKIGELPKPKKVVKKTNSKKKNSSKKEDRFEEEDCHKEDKSKEEIWLKEEDRFEEERWKVNSTMQIK